MCVLQRNIDELKNQENDEKSRSYLDDVMISGSSNEEHDRNLDSFLSMVRKYGFTLNQSNCEFGINRIQLLGHILEDVNNRPDSIRLKTLKEYPLLQTKPQL